MENKKKILYIEDMKACYEKTKETLGSQFDIDWKNNYPDALDAIMNGFEQYSAGIFDVNLDYIKDLPIEMQSTEGFTLMKIARLQGEKRNVHFPILCASKNPNYEKRAEESGADKFICKKEFWEKGKGVLEDLIAKV